MKELQTKEIRCKKVSLMFKDVLPHTQQFEFNWTGNNQSPQTVWVREGEPIAKRDGADTGYTVVKLKEEKFEERDTPAGGKMSVNVSTVIIRRNSDGEEIELVCGEKKDTDVIEAVLVFPKNDKWLRWLSEKQEFTLRDGTYRVVSINETEKTVTVEDTATGRISVIGVDGVVAPPPPLPPPPYSNHLKLKAIRSKILDTDVIEAIVEFIETELTLLEKEEFPLYDETYRVVSINETEKTVTVVDTTTGRISVIDVDGVVVPPETEEDDEEEEGTAIGEQERVGDSDDDSTADDTSGEDDGKTGDDDGMGPEGKTPPDDVEALPEDITFLDRLDKKMLRVWAKAPETSAYVRWAARNRLHELERK